MMWIPAFLVPLLVAGAIAVTSGVRGEPAHRLRTRLVRFSWLAVVPAGIAAAVDGGGEHRVGWLLLGTTIRLDGVGGPLLGMAVVLYAISLAFVVRSKAERPHVLTAFLLLCFTGNIGVFVAADLVTFYLAFAAMSFLGYAIVVHDGSPSARRAGAIYLVLTVLGECAVLAAMMLIGAGGSLRIADAPAIVAASPQGGLIIALLLIGFGVKVGTVPLHVWLPLAHPAAPSPASAVLSGAMLKAGLIGWLRFLPLGEGQAEPGWGTAFVALALIGALIAVPFGLLQDNPKVILAYSSIGQMGFLAALVGVALAVPELAAACIAAVVVYAVSHGLVKGALFLGVQAWDSERMPRWAVVAPMAVASAALVGAPLTSGYIAKYGAKEAVGAATVPAGAGVPLADLLPWVGVGSALLLARFAVVMWRRARSPRPTAWSRDVAWALLCVGAVVPVTLLAERLSPPQRVPGWIDPSALWAQSWPLLLGVGLAVAAAFLVHRRAFDESHIAHPRGDIVPPGDLVVIEERATISLMHRLARAFAGLGAARGRLVAVVATLPSPIPGVLRAQRRLGRWTVSGLVLLLVLAAGLLAAGLGAAGAGS